ncbi:rplT [Wigglesworthia glossinidia endosymbiont of Glossina brevipalpis]|uniref:Large ribosomal subunit protein bL20 n=1 Tax=Wigglesworthia glossinidia brevipalpis TaxID=36870 RepID=RL20_WIGBR|nr:RecName: Full=Large ribosomal subunit protein bL20; AltName: Full=50S ribosomal protein L20 [Wigglesworthia glossinidia endosymbiont of Glossina brevipalpis]BAC24230.1 rplT [Wigglesworthia glossinidia endosymbiont of Glossina brevipalpis]
MTRIKRGVSSKFRHKKILKKTKGYYGARSRSYRIAFQAFIKAGQYAYRDRKNKKRTFRKIWICRINSAVRKHGLSYSCFMYKIKKLSIFIDRKILSDLAVLNKEAFSELIKKVKSIS